MVFMPNIFGACGAQYTLILELLQIFYHLFQKASSSIGEKNKGVSYTCKKLISAFVSIAPLPPSQQKSAV